MTILQGLGLAASSLLILSAAPAQYFGRQHDDLLYFIASQALSQGGYRLLTTPGLPPLVMLTPGFPLLLLPLALFFGEWVPAYQVFCCLILAASPWLVWALLKKDAGSGTACLIALHFASSPLVLSQAGTVMTEGTYTVLTLLLVAWLHERRSRPAGFLLLALASLRPAGLSLLPAALLRPLKTKRWKEVLWLAGPALLGVAAWSAWSYSVHGAVVEAEEFVLSYGGQPATHPVAVALDNARFYLSTWGSCHLPPAFAEGRAALLAGAALAGLALAGLYRRLRSDVTDPGSLALLGAFAMHAVWAWQYERYLICLLPWLLWAAAAFLRTKAVPVLAALLAAQLLFHSHRFLAASPWSKPELSETYSWIASSATRPGSLLASPLYVRDGYYTARPSVPLPDTADPGSFARLLKERRASLVLWQDRMDIGLTLDKSANLRRKVLAAGRHLEDRRFFRLVYENPREGSRVYALR
ncbi:MAG: hypothetical protein HY748_13385 [Elusimicrobia bacterium]|nr:hypothetical protein [Elusimicrobiota bacterium]